MDMNNIDIKINNEDHTLIVLCSLSSFCETLLYMNDSILVDVSNTLY